MDFKKVTDLLNLTTPFKEDTTVPPKDTSDSEKEYVLKQEPLEELFSWKAVIPEYKISKKILRSGFVFIFLFAVFLVLAQDWMFLLVLLGFTFVVNLLLNNKESKDINYIIYNNGFMYGSVFYSWEQLLQFYFYEGDQNLIVIDSKDVLPGRIYVYVNSDNKQKVEETLNKYIPKNLVHPKDFYELVIFKLKPYLNLSDDK